MLSGSGDGGRGVEDGGHAERVRECEAMLDDGQRELELGDEDAGVGEERSGGVDFGFGDLKACAGNDDDGVLALLASMMMAAAPVGLCVLKRNWVSMPSFA